MNTFFRLAALSGLILFLSACGGQETKDNTATESQRAEKVKTIALEKTKINRRVELSSTLEGYETVNIAPSVNGHIEHIYVEVGSNVKAGDMLVRMDQNQLNTAKLTFANLGVELDRNKALRETNTTSQQSYDQVKLNYDQSKENVDFLTANTFVKTPITGVVSEKNYEDGELYAGNPILVVTQIHLLKALVNIPESYFPHVKSGMAVDVKTEIYPDQIFPATIEIVYPTIDQNTHTFQVKLRIKNDRDLLRPGMFVRTTFNLDEVEALLVPYQAVLKLTGSNNRYVFIDDNGVAKRVDVTLGDRYDEMIDVYSRELKEGDRLVSVGQAKLIDGTKLDVVK
ncbi:efflux RND transporter periplasmic adaptor subunit [Draconibacterium sp.]|jgi:RND family efflux transporter MFP subunit|uniref:efflux RND transporter periplasmic adaptor subunit n=1 Tax=Draconibacterium sp. TaxID=1965318 RepID=UPI0035690A8F